MIYNMTMMVNIHEAKAKLSELLNLLEQGEKIYICKRNIPLAELKPIATTHPGRRPLGLAQGKVQVDMTHFFDPLTEEELQAWGYHPANET
ncbi:MAG: type II toxin-antitoxin system Phd/YefM family antitoxin [Patescibacteria group bacterium]